jgi:RND family efflux transporter MFP subunit
MKKEPLSPIPSDWMAKVFLILFISGWVLAFNVLINPGKYAREVQAETMELRDLKVRTLCTGVLGYRNASEVKSEIAETIARKLVSEGAQVNAGDLLLELSSAKQKITLQKEQDRLRDSENEVRKARKELAVQKELFRKQAVARSSVEKAEADLAKAVSNLELNRQEFELEKKNFLKTKITAPVAGTVLIDFVQRETSIESGKPVFTIGTPNLFQVNGKVDELNIGSVRQGAEVLVQVDAFPEASLLGTVNRIAAQAESGSFSKIPVVIDILDTKGLKLKANLSVQAYISGDKISRVLSLPTEAVKSDGTERFVFKIGSGMKVRRQPVKIGRIANERVEIVEGLEPGDLVAVTDTDFLAEGQSVRVRP